MFRSWSSVLNNFCGFKCDVKDKLHKDKVIVRLIRHYQRERNKVKAAICKKILKRHYIKDEELDKRIN